MSANKKSIQVAIKVRPLLKKEKDQQSLWRVVDNSIQLTDSQSDPIFFDHIFDQDASNQVIFDKVAKPIVHSAIEGFNGTIFAYGQTSSGKTYTMMGDDENPGVMVLAAKEIFRQIEITTERQFLLRIGYIEIYNEKIYDLLNKKNQDLKIHETANGLVSVNCEESIITCEEDFLQHLTQGSKERTVGETNMNERSSRSHAIFRIIIESRKMDRSEDDSVTQSVLNLVDLAGSERADQTGARGTRLKEGGHINKSLLFLSNVIKRLSEDEDHKYISYRDSKLTRILQASLGGNALTAIICTIKPTAVEETQSTLNFALRAKIIKTKPQVNETVSDATMMKRLEREIKMLKTRLEEEQRKNESQIKVRQLEQRIRNEDLKIISCNSLHSGKNREKRRRTWCPSSTNHDSSANQLPSALPVPPSRLQPPKTMHYLTPLITMKPKEPPAAPKAAGGLPLPDGPLPEIDEEFSPAELVNFEMLSPLQTPKLKITSENRVSITPRINQNVKKLLEIVEHDLMELQEFTNLENVTEIQHDTDAALKQLVHSLTNRNAVLEKERLEYLEYKSDFDMTRDRLNDYEKRCDDLQIQVTKLTCSNKAANEKINQYEKELSELKAANEKLAMENREAVNLEFEFARHKNKSKLRENELLELLKDKEKEVTKLEKSLKSISEEQLQNTKEELLQLSLGDTKLDEEGKVCVKCVDLQRLLEDNRKVTQVFENLTLEYEQLKLNFQEIEKENNTSKARVVELEELQKSESAECDILRKELKELKEKLYGIQNEYEQVNLESSSKNQECAALNQQIEAARQEMLILQDKYNALELSWQSQQQTLKDIELQYAEIENKYQNLQTEFKQLECSKGESLTDCERLQKENVELLSEIDDLKLKLKEVQQQLLENAEKSDHFKNGSAEDIINNSSPSKVQNQNENLQKQLSELQTQFEDLQKEYDDLSNQLMDNLQESESLREQNAKLEEKVKGFEAKCAEVSKVESEMSDLKSHLEKMASDRRSLLNMPSPCNNSSMRSSGVCIEEEEVTFEECNNSTDDLHKKFCQLSECLTQIELEHKDGKKRVFKTPSALTTPNYKLCLRNISGIRKVQKDFTDEMENIHLHGSFTQHSFHIVELNGSTTNEDPNESSPIPEENFMPCENCSELIQKLRGQITDLKSQNEEERQSNKALLENTERTLCEMREQITQLSAELLEKSIFVENCACKTYQKQIECLEKEKADITIMCEELQEKVSNFTFDGSLMSFTNSGVCDISKTLSKGSDVNAELDSLRSKYNELQETLESQTKMLEDLTQKNLDLESDLKSTQEEMESQEKTLKAQYNQLQLEMLEKLEISANKHRDNMKKYNSEWEEKREEYENTIKELQNQLQNKSSETNKSQDQVDIISDLQNGEKEISNDLHNLKLEFDELHSKHSQLIEEHNQRTQEWNDLQAKSSKLIKEKEELYKNLGDLRQNYKSLNEQFNSLVMEKQSLYEENQDVQKKLNEMEDLQRRLDSLLGEKEQLEVEIKQLQQKLHSAEMRIEEYCTEDANREEMIKALQNKIKTLSVAEEEKLNIKSNLEKLQEELTHTQSTMEKLKEEKNVLEQKLTQLTDVEAKQQKDTEIQLSEIKEEKQILEDKLKEYDILQSHKASLEEQLRSFEMIVEEKQKMEHKLKDFEVLQEAHSVLEAEIQQERKTLEDKVKQYELIESQKKMMEEQLKSLESLAEEKLEMEKKLQDFELLQETNKALQEKITKLEDIQKEKQDLETKLKDIKEEKQNLETNLNELKAECKENLESLKSLKEEKDKLENILTEEKEISLENAKQLNILKDEKESIENHLEELKQKNTDIENQLMNQSKDLQSLREEKTKLEQQIDQKSLETEDKSKEIEVLQNKLSSLENNLQQIKKTLDDLKCKEIMSLEENESLRQTIETLTNSSVSLELEKCNLDKQVNILYEDLKQLRSDNKSLNNQIKSLSEAKISLTEQCSQLKEEKITLEEQLKCLGEKAKIEESLNQMINEKAEIAHNLRLTSEKLQSKQEELDGIAKDCEKAKRDVEMLKCSLLSSNREKQQLEERLEEFKTLSEEKSKLEESLTNLQSLYDKSLKSFEEEKENVHKNQIKYEKEISLYKQKEETLGQKMDSLHQQLHEMRLKTNSYEKLMADHKEMEMALNDTTKEKSQLANEITQLKKKISEISQDHNETEVQVQKLELQLCQSKKEEQELRKSFDEMQAQLQNENRNLQRQLKELKGNLGELQQKYESLQASRDKLQTENLNLQQQINKSNEQLKERETLKQELTDLKMKYSEIQQKMEATVEEAGRCSRALRDELQNNKQLLEKQLETYNALQKEMTSQQTAFEMEKEKLTLSLNSLQTENSSLEEKIREITVNNFKQDLQRQATDGSANTSFEGGNSSSSPRARKSLDSMNISVEDKICSGSTRVAQQTAERKNRRLSTFNERRSSYWGVTHDKETMTMPMDNSCKCEELDRKLQESEKKLFIRESQVTALNMELKNHPLKDQNAALMKRLQEEQDKYRIEVKRYKQKLYDQTMKTEKALATAAAATAAVAKSSSESSPSSNGGSEKPPIILENAETQTDCELSASLNKLQSKYNDLINICRYRKNTIKGLEEKLAQKENSDCNSMSTLDAGQMTILKSQCESMKKELKLIKEKYENAKIVLHSRREEISRLRSQLGQT